jgi:hypothetical protein
MPRDPRFRSLVKARPGYVILAADYASIELRIAAVLAERAVADLRIRIEGGDESWFVRQVRGGMHAASRLVCPQEPESWDLRWMNDAIPAVAQVSCAYGARTMRAPCPYPAPTVSVRTLCDRSCDQDTLTLVFASHRKSNLSKASPSSSSRAGEERSFWDCSCTLIGPSLPRP